MIHAFKHTNIKQSWRYELRPLYTATILEAPLFACLVIMFWEAKKALSSSSSYVTRYSCKSGLVSWIKCMTYSLLWSNMVYNNTWCWIMNRTRSVSVTVQTVSSIHWCLNSQWYARKTTCIRTKFGNKNVIMRPSFEILQGYVRTESI